MATLRYLDYEDTALDIEYVLSPSKFYSKAGGEWVCVDITLNSGEAYPQIHITSEGQETHEIEKMLHDLLRLARHEIDSVDFEPLEPDYQLLINHNGRGKYEKDNIFNVWVVIHAQGSGGYYDRGLAIKLAVTSEEIKGFVSNLETEYELIKRDYENTDKLDLPQE